MLESNSIKQSCGYFNFSVPYSIHAIMKRGAEELLFLLMPEETSEKGDRGHSDFVNTGMSKTRGTVKGVFWIAASVAAALTIGQLQ